MSEGLDEGPKLFKKEYKISQKSVDFDYVLDPLVRTKTLIEFLKKNKINPIKQNRNEQSTTFYIIHPLLKHLSILKYNKKL